MESERNLDEMRWEQKQGEGETEGFVAFYFQILSQRFDRFERVEKYAAVCTPYLNA